MTKRYELCNDWDGGRMREDPTGDYVWYDDYEELRDAVVALRRAQRAYLADRGNEELGAAVARAADYVDEVLRD